MYSFALSFLLASVLALSNANTLKGAIDTKRLQTILEEGLKSKDISTLYYSIKGLKQLNAKVPDVCQDIKAFKYDIKNIEQIFYLTQAASLSGCVNYLNPDVLKASAQILDNKNASIQDLYYAIYSQKALGKGSVVDKDDALKNLIQLLKKDDSPANYGYVFALCEHMGCESWTSTHAEGVLLAADETEGKALHFEGGLPVTSLVLSTIIRSYKAQNKPSPLTEVQRYKFAQYLLSRRTVNTPRGAAFLLEAASALADDENAPINITIKGRKFITVELDTLEISISDILGRPVRGLIPKEVVAQSGTRLSDDVVVLSKIPLTPKPDGTTFLLNLSIIKTQYGYFKVTLTAAGHTAILNVSVLGEIALSSVEVGVGDVDGTTSPKVNAVAYPNKLEEKLQADLMQKVSLKFTVRDNVNKAFVVQQAFVRVGRVGDEDETIFVAEPDNTKAYKVDLGVASLAKHLKHISGAYTLTIFIGDPIAANPIAYTVCEVLFNFGKDSVAVGDAPQPAWKVGRGPLPEIKHLFREPEPRPPRVVSDVFACACAAPLLLLLALWAKLRVNLSNFPFTPSALLFHAGLGASFGLYGLLWLQLSMFDTVRYLLPLGALTFLSGHRLLRTLAQNKSLR